MTQTATTDTFYRVHVTIDERRPVDASVSVLEYRPLQYDAEGTAIAWEPTTPMNEGVWRGVVKVADGDTDKKVLAKVEDALAGDGWRTVGPWDWEEEAPMVTFHSADVFPDRPTEK